MKIYLLEDDLDLAYLVSKVLKEQQWEVSLFQNGPALFKTIIHSPIINDFQYCFILDIMIPGFNGDKMVDTIREKYPNALIMMHSAINDPKKQIECLVLGADHYLTKPYSANVLVQHIKTHIRKGMKVNLISTIQIDSWKINFEKRTAKKKDTTIRLEHKEVAIIKLLYEKQSEVTRKDLLSHIWGINEATIITNRLRSCISSIRKKLGKQFILYVKNKGYCLGNSKL